MEILENSDSRISSDQSDHLVELIYKERSILESNNNTRKPLFAKRRDEAWRRITEDFNSRFSTSRSQKQLSRHYQHRKSKVRGDQTKLKRYRSETGGGIDFRFEEEAERLQREFGRGDALLLEMTARTPASLGVGPEFADTGFCEELSEGEVSCEQFGETKKKKWKMNEIEKKGNRSDLMSHERTLAAFRAASGAATAARAQSLGYSQSRRVASVSLEGNDEEWSDCGETEPPRKKPRKVVASKRIRRGEDVDRETNTELVKVMEAGFNRLQEVIATSLRPPPFVPYGYGATPSGFIGMNPFPHPFPPHFNHFHSPYPFGYPPFPPPSSVNNVLNLNTNDSSRVPK